MEVKMSKKSDKKIPEGVKVLSALYFFGAVVSMLIASFLFNFYDSLTSGIAGGQLSQMALMIEPLWVLVAGIALIAMGVLDYFIGRGLLKLQNWARIVVSVFAVLGIVGSISNLSTGAYATGIFSLALSGLIAWYMLIRKETKKAFN